MTEKKGFDAGYQACLALGAVAMTEAALPSGSSPARRAGVGFGAEPALAKPVRYSGREIVFLPGYMVDALASVDADVALDDAGTAVIAAYGLGARGNGLYRHGRGEGCG
tara:strand:- start:35970 stop:36296 length:327 start_codon:yes stop_codon:yes gene_type:complete